MTISSGQPTLALPLLLVVLISMFKDGLEDYKRAKSDKEENERKVLASKGGESFEHVSWKDLSVGDIIKVK